MYAAAPAYLRPALEAMVAGTSCASDLPVITLHSSMCFKRTTAPGASSVFSACTCAGKRAIRM